MDNIRDWKVYILQCADNTYYTGITKDMDKRLAAHQKGQGARYTSQRLPVKVVYIKSGYTESEARKEEFVIKSWKRDKKEKLINGEVAPHLSKGQSRRPCFRKAECGT